MASGRKSASGGGRCRFAQAGPRRGTDTPTGNGKLAAGVLGFLGTTLTGTEQIDFEVNLSGGKNRPSRATLAVVEAHDSGSFQLFECPQNVLLGAGRHRGQFCDRLRLMLGDRAQ